MSSDQMSSLSTDPCFLNATEALQLFRRKALSPVELLDAQIARAESVEPTLNALSDRYWERALEQARAAERCYLAAPDKAGALTGVPTVIKNEHAMVGARTTQGSWIGGDEPDTENAPIVQRLLDAGAVIHAQGNVPEFFLATFTRSERHGVTRNPWNPEFTPGGSSGGCAAALASGITTLATGSDIGGSIRVPSAYCGTVGLKPSYGRVPEATFFYALNTCNHNGAMARSVADCLLMFNVINGPHPVDPATVKPAIQIDPGLSSVSGLRIALSADLGFFRVAPDVARNTRETAAMLRALGAEVEEIALDWDASAGDAISHILGFTMGPGVAEAVDLHGNRISDYVRTFAERTRHITQADYLAAHHIVERMHRALQKVLVDFDALICPTMAALDTPAEGVADSHAELLDKAMTYPFNLLSRHPVLSVPSGFGATGVPTGLQIVGRTFDEPTVFRIGLGLEKALRWNARHPQLAADLLQEPRS